MKIFLNLIKKHSILVILFTFISLLYIMVIYPQQIKKNKKIKIIKKLKENDEILINNCIVGKITKILTSKYVEVLINKKTKIIIKKSSISLILPTKYFKK